MLEHSQPLGSILQILLFKKSTTCRSSFQKTERFLLLVGNSIISMPCMLVSEPPKALSHDGLIFRVWSFHRQVEVRPWGLLDFYQCLIISKVVVLLHSLSEQMHVLHVQMYVFLPWQLCGQPLTATSSYVEFLSVVPLLAMTVSTLLPFTAT